MRKTLSYFLFTLLLAAIACACSDDIDIKQDYEFSVTHLPVPKKLQVNEVAEIRCTLHREGKYGNTRYYLRYFQYDGEGQLWMGNGKPFLPNDPYEVTDSSFRLYFRSLSEDAHNIEVVFFDSFGKEYPLSFTFNNEQGEDEDSNV
ncbi:hypothetical protein M2137_001824 [Parabacteroides sp. PFB2-10]|uniref:TraQ conjugal transfer family protein n=1 Tax=Parabacteroides sp. PFB2-10 TaxID=1742405 RepID=UPI002475F816|nr:TraQ conjugal transfer family protein [Parabacteroides sp. PFB2-10]MDH6313037.1 hypothetical protein [Parabacteroides sp. PFB2-10]MDL2208786.1 DUF3872 domain-containing protein [Parabacteroides sp. OttesenSCG-928-O15]MDL2281584.1 DUF3872 domain-containing protein [Parabacteroides sp. OttesenSCG-928-G06]